MAKFNLHDFVMKTIHKMITSGIEAEYKVMQYSLNYYDKGIITDEDMLQISEWIAEQEEIRLAKEAEAEVIFIEDEMFIDEEPTIEPEPLTEE